MMISKCCLPLSLHLYNPIYGKRKVTKYLLKNAGEISSWDWIRNVNSLINKMDVEQNDFEWIGKNIFVSKY